MMHHLKQVTRESQEPTLFDQYGSTIFAYLRLQTASREDAEDLTLDVFTAALERNNLADLREPERLAWLRRVARNKVVDTYRHGSLRQFVPLEEVEELLFFDNGWSPEQTALFSEEINEVKNAIRGLPPLQQQVLGLRYGADLSIAEIAQLLQKREPAVRKLLSRALSFLRTICSHQEREGDTTR